MNVGKKYSYYFMSNIRSIICSFKHTNNYPKIGFILIVIAGLILSTLLKLIRNKSAKLMNKLGRKKS